MSARTPRRRAVWVSISGCERLAVEVVRECKAFTRCRVVEPGPYFGTVQDFHPDDVRDPDTLPAS